MKKVGSSLDLQKALERELKDVEVGPEDPGVVAEMKAEAERMEDAAKAREVMVHKVPQGKVCGGVRLQFFPEGSGNRKTEKREALLTIIELCPDLTQADEERLGSAGVEVSRPERGRKGTVEVKIMLEQADELMRKVWSQLEVSCREEGVKRYMIKASTDMSPVKEKPKTALQQARTRVVRIVREEEEKRMKDAEEQRKKASEEKKMEEESVTEDTEVLSQPPVGKRQENTQGVSPHCPPPKGVEETETLAISEESTLPQKKARNKDLEDSLSVGSHAEDEAAMQLQDRPVPSITETLRVKGQKWTPPQGHRRCSGNCSGCQRKCKELLLDDCQSCYLNKVKNTNSNGCCNRDACTNLRVIKKIKKINNSLEDESTSLGLFELSQVDSIVNDFEKKGVDKEKKDMEEDLKKGKKRHIAKGGTPEDMKRSSQIARITVTGGTSKLIAPRKPSFPTN